MAGVVQTMTIEEFAQWAEETGRDLANLDFTPAFKRCRVILAADIKRNFAEGHSPDGVPWIGLAHPRARGGDQPLRDRGILMASATAQGEGHVEEMDRNSLTFGTNLDYAAIHQDGGTIAPTNAKALSIPLTPEAARAGGASHFPGDLFVFKSRGGHALLAEAKPIARSTQLTFHYVLVSQVKIPARPFVGISKDAADEIEQVFGDFVGEQLE